MRWLMMRFSVNVGLGVWCVLFDLFVTIDLGYFTLYDSPRQIFQKDFTQGESYYVKYSWFIWPNCFAIWDIISVFERKQLQTKKPISKQTTVWQVLSKTEWATRAHAGPESLLSVPRNGWFAGNGSWSTVQLKGARAWGIFCLGNSVAGPAQKKEVAVAVTFAAWASLDD